MATSLLRPIPSINVTNSSSPSPKPPPPRSLSPPSPFRAASHFPHHQTRTQPPLDRTALMIRRDFLSGVSLLIPLLLDVESPPPSAAREVEVGAYLPPSPADPSFVLFKASPKDTPALRAGNLYLLFVYTFEAKICNEKMFCLISLSFTKSDGLDLL